MDVPRETIIINNLKFKNMKIYLCYCQKENENRVVLATFSNKEKAKNYCKVWNNAAIKYKDNITYFYKEDELDYFAENY